MAEKRLNHSPGPWHQRERFPYQIECATRGLSRGRIVADVTHPGSDSSEERAAANALLISLAPEMLELVRTLYRHRHNPAAVGTTLSCGAISIMEKIGEANS
jgi:hypothetical protein